MKAAQLVSIFAFPKDKIKAVMILEPVIESKFLFDSFFLIINLKIFFLNFILEININVLSRG